MVEIVFRKRPGREGEMGLFLETPIFDEEWQSIKIGTEVKALCTVPSHLRYIRFFHALCGKVADNCDWLIDKEDAKERILLEARHAKIIHDPLRNKTEIKAKSVANLSGDKWIRLLKRATHVVVTKFIPGMDEGSLKVEIEAMLGIDILAEKNDNNRDPSPSQKEGSGGKASEANGGDGEALPDHVFTNTDAPAVRHAPTNEAEYISACRSWLHKQTNRFKAFDYFNGTIHQKMRKELQISDKTRKNLEHQIKEYFDAKDREDKTATNP